MQAAAKFTACLLVALAAGCGGSGAVKASGKVTIEGDTASSGRLSIVPVGMGVRADSLVSDDGAFVFRSQSGTGAMPGSYHIVYTRSLNYEGMPTRAGVNQVSADEQSVIYQSPPDRPLVITEDGSDGLTIDIRKELGWSRNLSE